MSMDVNTWKTMLLSTSFSASSTGLVTILSNLLCVRAMAPKKAAMKVQNPSSKKVAAKKSAAQKPNPKEAPKPKSKPATVEQAAQKRLKATLDRKKLKALNPNATQADKDAAQAATEVENKYRSLRGGEKASFALELEQNGIQPGKLQWMATYGKDASAGERNVTTVDKGMMTRYLH